MRKNIIILFAILFSGCSVLEVDSDQFDGMAMIEDVFGGPRVVEVDGAPPQRVSHEFRTLLPYVYVKPGKYVFKIESDGNGILVGEKIRTIEVDATVEEGMYAIVEEKGEFVFKRKKDSNDDL